MKLKFKYILIIFCGILFPQQFFSQEIENDSIAAQSDNLGNVTDAFQENFFEALKQKGIENYELALIALNKAEKAAKTEENKSVVYFEMGKNHTYLKQYAQAEENFNKVLKSEGDRLDVLEQFYELYYQQKEYEKSTRR